MTVGWEIRRHGRIEWKLNPMMKGWLGCGEGFPGRGLDQDAKFFDRLGRRPKEIDDVRRNELQSLGVFHEERCLNEGLRRVRYRFSPSTSEREPMTCTHLDE